MIVPIKTSAIQKVFTLLGSLFLASTCLVANPAMAVISYVTSTTDHGNDDLASLTVPNSVAAEDVLLVQVVITDRRGSDGVTAPSGWTIIGSQERDDDVLQSLYYRVATASDPGVSYTWDFDQNGNRRYVLGMSVFRGVDTSVPIDAQDAQTGMSGTQVTAPAITTSGTNTMLVGLYSLEAGDQSFSPASGMLEAYDAEENNNNNGLTTMASYALQAAAGPTGDKDATASKSNDDAIGHLIALTEGGPDITPPVAIDDSSSAITGATITVDLGGNDTDVGSGIDLTSITIITAPINGTIDSINADGTVDYTHDGGASTADSFTYTINDASANTSNIATVTIDPISLPPSPLAEWRLDEDSWNGNGNEVLDNGGNNLHGFAVDLSGFPPTNDTDPAIIGDPGTCGYGDFNGLSDGYVQIDDPGTGSILDFASEFSVSVWVYPRSLPSGSNLASIVSKDENYEFHLNSSGRVNWWWGGGSRSLTSTSSVTLNQWNHITITYRSGAQVIYINGAASGTNTSTDSITLNNDPVLIGTDLNFHSRRFDGLIDEVRLYDAELSPVEVTAVMADTHACSIISAVVDHYEIDHSGSGITCEAESVTIRAHDSSDVSIDADGITIELSATSSTPGWSANDANWTLETGSGALINTGSGVAEYTFDPGETEVVVGLSNISVADIDIDIVDTSDPTITDQDGAAEDPQLGFTDTALRFYNDADNNGDADGTDPITGPFVAGDLSTPFVLKAIETDGETGTCVARSLDTQNVALSYECRNPDTCVRNQDMQINGSPIEENDAGSVVDVTTLTLTFDGQSEVPMTLRYFDAGQVRLHASTTLAASGSDPAITIEGSSAAFVVQPADFIVSSVTDSAATANPGTTSGSAGFVSAGTPFTVHVEAQNSAGGLTPNFGRENSPEQIELRVDTLAFPSSGNNPALSSPANFSVTGTAGIFENTSVSWAEAGTITLNTHILDSDYLDSGDILGSASGNIGRFYPEFFQLESSTLAPECAAANYNYMSDQAFSFTPIDIEYTVSAQGVGTGTLLNYDSALSYPVASFEAQAENANDGVDLSDRGFIPIDTWVSGEMIVDAGAGFRRNSSAGLESADGPYSALQFGIRVASNLDNVNFTVAALNMDTTTAGVCSAGSTCDAITLDGSQNIRFGRLYGKNAHGSEAAALPVTLLTQYWDGTSFVTNADDFCTTITASDTLFDGADISTDANRTVTVSSGNSTGTFSLLTPGSHFEFTAGESGLEFSAPGATNTGTFFVDISLTNYPWLRSDWDQNGDSSNDSALPSIEINFGSYRGHDRIIYWREILD